MAGQSAKMGPVLRGEISNTQSRPLNGHPPSFILCCVYYGIGVQFHHVAVVEINSIPFNTIQV